MTYLQVRVVFVAMQLQVRNKCVTFAFAKEKTIWSTNKLVKKYSPSSIVR